MTAPGGRAAARESDERSDERSDALVAAGGDAAGAAHASDALEPEPPVPAAPIGRMGIAALSLIGLMISIYMSLYKLGVFGVIACGAGDCDRVQNSPWAAFFGVPVPYIGVLGYGALMAAALTGMQPRFVRDRRIAAVLFGGAAIGLAFSAYLTYLEAAVINAWCRYCIVSAALATLIFLFAIPEFRRMRRDG